MESQPVSNPSSPYIIDTQELTAYQHLTSFNLFLYSQSALNTPLFLLYKGASSTTFTHCSGNFTKVDPNMFFAVTREFITQNRGLLYSKNLAYFQAERASHFEETDIELVEDLTGIVRPQKGFTPPIDDICRRLCDCPYIFQDNNGNVSYFVDIPLLSMEAVKEAIQMKGLSFEMKYFTLEEIMDKENKDICEKLRGCFDEPKLLAYTQKFIVNAEPIEIKEHYAIITCEPVIKTSLVDTLHYSVHRKHGENWKLYKAFEGELPTDEELKKIKGIIVPGSSCSAYADHPWFKDVFECLRKIIHEYKHINFLGICFGAQIVAQALGGRVEKMARDFKRGEDVLEIQPTFFELDYIRGLGLDTTQPFAIGQAHGDHIAELPAEAVLHASSATARVEIYTIGNNVLALQGHPEYTAAWTAGTYFRKNKLQVEDYDSYAEEYIKEVFPVPIRREELMKICYTFLKKDSVENARTAVPKKDN